jgi:two-component system OmpR family sensor kinase
MNNEEKRALFSFLSIYVLSSVVFMVIISYMYFDRESSMLEDHCSMSMSEAAMSIKSDILQTYMNEQEYKFKPSNEDLNYAILKDDKTVFFNSLAKGVPTDLNKRAHHGKERSIHVLELDDKKIDLRYIIVEDLSGIDMVSQLKYKIFALFTIGIVLMATIGYFLSRILLKPVQEKSEQLNRFVKDSSHELNTPITALMMIVANIKKRYEIEDKTINQMVASTKHIKQTYDKLLFNVNGDIVEVFDEVFDLKDVIDENILFIDEIAKSKDITLNCDIQSCKIKMDRQSAYMVVNNLISNAIKYTKKRKSIYIELKDSKLLVKDEGIGISEAKQKQIFARYKRVTSEEGGFGIGLDIVSSVCKKYNIGISLESKEKVGSSFTLDFTKCKAS